MTNNRLGKYISGVSRQKSVSAKILISDKEILTYGSTFCSAAHPASLSRLVCDRHNVFFGKRPNIGTYGTMLHFLVHR